VWARGQPGRDDRRGAPARPRVSEGPWGRTDLQRGHRAGPPPGRGAGRGLTRGRSFAGPGGASGAGDAPGVFHVLHLGRAGGAGVSGFTWGAGPGLMLGAEAEAGAGVSRFTPAVRARGVRV